MDILKEKRCVFCGKLYIQAERYADDPDPIGEGYCSHTCEQKAYEKKQVRRNK